MIPKRVLIQLSVATLSWFVFGCALSEPNGRKKAPVGFITTPPSYYSSAKGRYLGERYKDNLNRLAELIVRNPKTANLQFANNIASVGGIGFFTHSATNVPDERFLEVVVSAPETFETKEDFDHKVSRMFGAYGTELLSILASDSAIYRDKDVSGYGLNLTWRTMVGGSTGNRLALERAVIYVPKGAVQRFLHQEIDQSHILAEATVFSAEENGRMNLVSYRPEQLRQETRLPIQEEILTAEQGDGHKISSSEFGSRSTATKERTAPGAMVGGGKFNASTAGGPNSLSKRNSDSGNVQGQDDRETTKAVGGRLAATKPERDLLRKIVTERAVTSHEAAVENSMPQTSLDGKSQAADQADHVKGERIRPSQSDVRMSGMAETDRSTSETKDGQKNASSRFRAAVQGQPVSGGFGAALPAQDNRGETPKSATIPIGRLGNGGPPTPVSIDIAPPTVNLNHPVLAKKGGPTAAVIPETDGPNVISPETRKMREGSPVTVAPKLSNEQIALQKDNRNNTGGERAALGRPLLKLLEGYIIQLAFHNEPEAQRWAQVMARRGYAISVTEADGAGSVRLRLGNFPAREEAERQLKSLKQEGLSGIIINLPQAYRPQARISEEAATAVGQ